MGPVVQIRPHQNQLAKLVKSKMRLFLAKEIKNGNEKEKEKEKKRKCNGTSIHQ